MAKTKKQKNPFNQAGYSFLFFVLALYVWTTLTVLCDLQNFNPLKFSLREQYSKVRGLQ